jgi:BlaI family transcriptional regulator, penicillinase repressor
MGERPEELVPTERELQALKVLWERGSATIREIGEALDEQGTELAYTTVLSLLQVMEQKGMVGHTAAGKIYTYHPRLERSRTLARLARGFLERVFDGALDEYVLHALEARRLSPAELRRLEDLVARAKQRRGQSRQEDSP